jgi:glucans biosynthesis protein
MKDDSGMGQGPNRRRVLVGAAAWSAVATVAQYALTMPPAAAGEAGEGGEPFVADHVKSLAQDLASRDYAKPRIDVPEPFNALTPKQYRDIRFRPEASIWRNDRLDYEIQLLALGWLYDVPVQIWLVEGGKARSLKADNALFSIGPSIENPPEQAPFGFSGFRINGTLNRADSYDDFVSFQGASYFKALGRGQQYGLAARGLAINTARPGGEEFPIFRAFWIERPQASAPEMVVYALLESESTTGAYRFVIRPGQATEMDVEAVLYPRRVLQHVGLAPLTSMFLHGSAHHRINQDYRPAVHNSEGLAVLNGQGERLWRPLTNPKMLQTSAFVDKDPKGFGLSQRSRSFSSYEDLDARFERRPTAWVEPKGAWGEGYIELIEIPVSEEIHDNIVAYWKPAIPLEPGKPYPFAYRIYWTDEVPVAWAGAKVVKTQIGGSKSPDAELFIVDFAGTSVKDLRELPVADLAVSAGAFTNLVIQRHPEIEGLRVRFELNTSGTDVIELRLGLKLAGQLISESWLYRWTRP